MSRVIKGFRTKQRFKNIVVVLKDTELVTFKCVIFNFASLIDVLLLYFITLWYVFRNSFKMRLLLFVEKMKEIWKETVERRKWHQPSQDGIFFWEDIVKRNRGR